MIPKCVVSFLVAVLVNYPGQRKFVFKKKDEEEVPEGRKPEDLQKEGKKNIRKLQMTINK